MIPLWRLGARRSQLEEEKLNQKMMFRGPVGVATARATSEDDRREPLVSVFYRNPKLNALS